MGWREQIAFAEDESVQRVAVCLLIRKSVRAAAFMPWEMHGFQRLLPSMSVT